MKVICGIPGKYYPAVQFMCPMQGRTLKSRMKMLWKVKVWSDYGESDWSETGILEHGHAT
jgi:hypothetical protein